MVSEARKAVRSLLRRRRAAQTLIGFACRLEYDAAGLAGGSLTLSPARLSVAVGDVSRACDHLVEATDAWGRWLEASPLLAVGAADTAVVEARERLRALRADLRRSSDSARRLSASLAEITRHNGRSGATP